jgi:hypothetical protein
LGRSPISSGILDRLWFTLIVAHGLVGNVTAPIGAVATRISTAATRADLVARAPNLRIRRAVLAHAEDEFPSR